jgi:histidine kinase-like protein
MTFIMPQAAAAVTLPYRWPRSLALRVGQDAREGDMSKRLPNGLAWSLLGLTVLLLAANVVLGLTGGVGWAAVFGFVPITLSFALVGVLIAVRAGNRLGWFFLAGATVTALSVAAKTYAARTPPDGLPGAAWAGWALTVSLGVTGTFLFLTPLLFPDGRPPSPRWRPVVWIAVIAGLAEAVSSAISDVNFSSDFPHLRDPVVLSASLGTVYNLATSAGPFVFLAGAISMIVRYRRSGPEQRQQLKWFVYAAAVSALVIFVAADFGNNPLPEVEITVPLIPVAVGIAIFKYRLYDIDRLISRTLAYAIVTGLLIGVYAGLVILAGVLGFSTPPAVAIATLAAAALFSPLRRRVQRAVDKRFNRVRYDAELTVAAFATRLRDAVDLDTVRAELLGVVDSAVQPAHISIWTAGRGPE